VCEVDRAGGVERVATDRVDAARRRRAGSYPSAWEALSPNRLFGAVAMVAAVCKPLFAGSGRASRGKSEVIGSC
jgi:hypothetical protein